MDQKEGEEDESLLEEESEEEEETPLMNKVIRYKGGNHVVPAKVVRLNFRRNCKRIESFACFNRIFLQFVDCTEARFTEIDKSAFRDCEGLQSFISPSTLKTIGERAFSGCINLRHVKLNDRVEKIGREAFRQCAIKYMPLPKALKYLNLAAFCDCWCLLEVAFQPGLKNELKGVFKGCNSLERVGKPRHIKLGKDAVPKEIEETVKVDGNHKSVWKLVNEKNEQVYMEWRGFRDAERNTRELMDVKPNVQSLATGAATTCENGQDASSKKELDEMADKLNTAIEERDALQAEKEKLENEGETKMEVLQAEKERVTREAESKMKALQAENDRLAEEAESKMKALQAAKDRLAQEAEAEMNAIRAEKDRLEREGEAKMKALQAERDRLVQDMEVKLRKANEEQQSLRKVNLDLEEENGRRLQEQEETDIKLQKITDSLQDEQTEKAGIADRLQLMTSDCRMLKAANSKLEKELREEKKDNQAQLLKAARNYGALEEKHKRLRKELISAQRGESVVSSSDDNEDEHGLEGTSIRLGSERGSAEKSKLSSVTGERGEDEELFQFCAEEVSKKSSRKRKVASSEEKSRKSSQGKVPKLQGIKKRLRKTKKVAKAAAKSSAEGCTTEP